MTIITEGTKIFTTYCPLTGESAPSSSTIGPSNGSGGKGGGNGSNNVGGNGNGSGSGNGNGSRSSTVIAVTTCSNGGCSTVVETTGVTVRTEGTTIYTTYCPLTGETIPSSLTSVPSNGSGAGSGTGQGAGQTAGQGSGSGPSQGSGPGAGQESIETSLTEQQSTENHIPSLQTVSIMQSSESSSSESNPAEISVLAAVGPTIGYSIGAVFLAITMILL